MTGHAGAPANGARSNSLRAAFQVSGQFVAMGMKYTRKSRMWAPRWGQGALNKLVVSVVFREFCYQDSGSVSGAIWRNILPDKLVEYLPESDKSKAMSIFQSIVNAKKYEIGSPVRLAIDRSFRESQMLPAIVATALCVPGLVIMWFIKTITLVDKEKEQGEEPGTAGETGRKASER